MKIHKRRHHIGVQLMIEFLSFDFIYCVCRQIQIQDTNQNVHNMETYVIFYYGFGKKYTNFERSSTWFWTYNLWKIQVWYELFDSILTHVWQVTSLCCHKVWLNTSYRIIILSIQMFYVALSCNVNSKLPQLTTFWIPYQWYW